MNIHKHISAKILQWTLILSVFFFIFSPFQTFAISVKDDPCNGESCFQSAIPEDELPTEIRTGGDIRSEIVGFIDYVLGFLGLVLIIIIIWAGVKVIFSGGDEEALGSAKKTVLYAVIGFLIIIFSYTIVHFIAGIATGVGGGTTTPTSTSTSSPTSSPSTSTSSSPSPSPTDSTDEDILQKLENLSNEIKNLKNQLPISSPQIDDLQKKINEMYKLFPKNAITDTEYQNLLQLLEKLRQDPNNKNLVDELTDNLGKFSVEVAKMPRVSAKISASPASGFAPFTVSLTAEKSTISDSNIFLKNENFSWFIINPDGVESPIGTGMNRSYAFEKSGKYIIRLEVLTKDAEGKQNSVAGRALIAITVQPRKTTPDFLVNGKTTNETLKFTVEQAKAGIVFDPSVTKAQEGRVIEKYLWNFANIEKLEKKSAEAVAFKYADVRKLPVSLTTVDNTGEQITKSITVEIVNIFADFSLSSKTPKLGETMKFDASKASSVYGAITEYKWKITDPAGKFFEYDTAQFSQKVDIPGKWRVELSVKDAKENIDSFLQEFSVEGSTPTAAFSVKNTGNGDPAEMTFDASGSADTFSKKLFFSWDFDNDGKWDVEKSEALTQNFAYTEAKKYTAILKVENDFGKTAESRKSVEIKSTLTAKFSTSSEVAIVGKPLTFLAESNKGIIFEWNFGDGTPAEIKNEKSVEHIFKKAGAFTVSLKASTKDGKEETTTKQKIFVGTPDNPVAVMKIFQNKNEVLPTENLCGSGKDGFKISRADTLAFSAENSINRDGNKTNLIYDWNFPEGKKESKSKVDWKFRDISEKGSCFPVLLTVSDKISGKKSMTQTLHFFVENAPPVLKKLSVKQPTKNVAPVPVALSAAGSSDADGKIVEYKWWAVREGSASSEKIDLHTTSGSETVITLPVFGNEGETNRYSFFVEIRDNDNAITSSATEFGESTFVEARTGPNQSPKVSFSMDKNSANMNDSIAFAAIAKSASDADINNQATFKWDFDGDNIFDDVTSGANVTHKYMQPGKYTVRLKVVFQGLATSAEKTVNIDRTSKLPLAAFIFQKDAGNKIYFDASNSQLDSSVKDNKILYEWDFDKNTDSDGDGNAKNDKDSSEQKPSFEYPKDFDKATVILKIKDQTSGEDTLERKIVFDEISGVMNAGSSSGNGSGISGYSSSLFGGGSSANESLMISCNVPMTTLFAYGGATTIRAGENMDIVAFTKNADGTPYSGKMKFEVVEGEGNFFPAEVKSTLGRSVSTFTSNSKGVVVIKITALETVSGEIFETLAFVVE